MDIATTRFGSCKIEDRDLLHFEQGLIGFEDCTRWALLADAQNPAVAWLQCIGRPDVALPLVSPTRFVHNYQVRVDPAQLADLQLTSDDLAVVLAVVSKHDGCLTMNLRAPLIINWEKGLGRQIITLDEQPLQHELAALPVTFRKSA